ncbi:MULTISPECIES: transcription termination/antitermination protein NusG [Rhodopseudomonas]|uniref:Transcription termination/antitermination protein NusG n=1 Tax=Rhodopseudomonas telluris TaxID=644215 RepID=A0ABV6EZJ9_9BRAD
MNMAVRPIESDVQALVAKAEELPRSGEFQLLPYYLLAVRSWKELDVVDSYRRRGFRAFWPNYQVMKPSRVVSNGRRALCHRRVGIIAGCVFVQLRQSDHASPLPMADGILGAFGPIRSHNGEPLWIGDADVRIIKLIEAGLNTPPAPGLPAKTFKAGEKVRFVDDVEARWGAGVVVRLALQGRIVVEIDAMGRKTEITVAAHQIERT